jgi:RNA polymerase sigma factor (sigma-70 family)
MELPISATDQALEHGFCDPEDTIRLGQLSLVPELVIQHDPTLPISIDNLVDADPTFTHIFLDDEYTPFIAKRFPKQVRNAYHDVNDSTESYLSEIGSVGTLLTAEEEVYLAKYVQARNAVLRLLGGGDTVRDETQTQDITFTPEQIEILERIVQDGSAAREIFIVKNLRLVVGHAKKRQAFAKHMELLDLIQEGNSLLGHAVDKFDWTKGFKFSTYAKNWIINGIDRGIVTTDREIYIPEKSMVMLRIIRKVIQEHDGSSPLTAETIAAVTGYKQSRVEDLMVHIAPTLELDAPIGEDGDLSLKDRTVVNEPNPADAMLNIRQSTALQTALDSLDIKSRTVITGVFGIGQEARTLTEIGKQFGLSRQSMGNVYKAALARLYEQLDERDFTDQ